MIYTGDLFDVLPTLPEASIDSCVTDPPYGLGFMGKQWDTFKPGIEQARVLENRAIDSTNPNLKGRTRSPASSPSSVEYDRSVRGQREFQAWCEAWAREVFRVLKPGAHMIVFGAPRSFHRMTSGVEDAGFEIRDCLSWLFGQGFPKSLNLGDGRGTALKPAWEPVILARKPLSGTVTANVAEFGTGTINIDAARVLFASDEDKAAAAAQRAGQQKAGEGVYETGFNNGPSTIGPYLAKMDLGRWPANVCLDDAAAELLDAQSGELVSGANPTSRSSDKFRDTYSAFKGQAECEAARGLDIGGASRFFYIAKPSRAERDEGCWALPVKRPGELTGGKEGSPGQKHGRSGTDRAAQNFHPTVKPVELMRWLVRLVTPIGGTVLDPFMGSGTTGMACAYELRPFIGIEREADYIEIAERRIASCAPLFQERG